jgi:hypothetical protein
MAINTMVSGTSTFVATSDVYTGMLLWWKDILVKAAIKVDQGNIDVDNNKTWVSGKMPGIRFN